MINFNSILNPMDKCNVINHEYCTELRIHMLNLIENSINDLICDNLIKRFLKIMQEIECWSLEYDKNIQILLYICFNYKLSFELKKNLRCNQNSEILQIYFTNIDLNNIPDEEINNIFLLNNYNSGVIREIIVNYFSKNNKFTKKIFDIIINTNCFEYLNKILDTKIDISYDDFLLIVAKLSTYYHYDIIKDDINFKNLINKLIFSGGIIKKSTMNDIFNKLIELEIKNLKSINDKNQNQNYHYFNGCFYEFIEYLIQNNCEIIDFNYIKIFLEKYNYKYVYSIRDIGKLINLLFDAGMKLTKQDIIYLINLDIRIINYSKLDFPINCDEIAFAQTKTRKNIYKIKEKYNLEILRNYCKTYIKPNKLKDICESVKPDIVCLENACELRNNNTIIRYLCDNFDLKINNKCIINLLKNTGSTIAYTIALQYEKQNKMIPD